MPIQITGCCYCFPLKAGVIVISLIWIISGIYMIVKYSKYALYLASSINDADMFKYESTYPILMIITSGLITIGATFGLGAVISNITRMLQIYSKIACMIAGIDIIGHVMAIAFFILSKQKALEKCYAANHPSDLCDDEYGRCLAIAIITGIGSCILSVYFAMVVSAYAQKQRHQENVQQQTPKNSDGGV